MLRFAHPEYLWGLAAVAAVAVLFYVVNRVRSQQFARMVSRTLAVQLAPDKSRTKRFLKQAIVLGSLSCLVLALANPQMGTKVEEIKREGIDLFIALDVSLSMKAEDIKPNRLDKAKRDVSNLLQKLAGDRVGLIVFSGDAFVQFPLTADYSAADLFISAVDVESVPRPGTMIGSAIEKALESFKAEDPTQKAIIIASDGENTEGDIKGAVEKALDAGVKVYTIGTGTPEGGPIPIYNAAGVRTDFKRDMSGKVVLSRLDETTLDQIATATGGTYRRATSGGDEIEEVFKSLSELQKTEFGAKQITGYESLYQYPLGLALLLMLGEFLLSERRGRVIAKLKQLIPVAGPAVLLLLLGASNQAHGQTVRSHVSKGNEAYAKEQYPDAEAEYKKALEKNANSRHAQFNLGDAYYKQKRYDEALKSFASSEAQPAKKADKSLAFYNVGNTLFKANKATESIEAYKQALRLDPTNDDARYNLEFVRKRQQQQQNQQQKQDKNQDKQKDDKQDQQQQKQDQQNKQDQQQKPPPQPKAQKQQIPPEQAEQILNALKNNEKEIQKQLRKRAMSKVRVEKDW
jgi:tetratricopeptide (TPR) repeat protein